MTATSSPRKFVIVPLLTIITLSGCMQTAAEHSAQLHSEADRKVTVGLVQKEIRKGMDQGEVATILGAPNFVTNSNSGTDVWIYDKTATEASISTSRASGSGALGGVGTPGSSLILGILTGNTGQASGATATSQKTLTVVIRFDAQQRVSDFSYHSSSF